ncbi:MAG: transposase family protein [Deltaproteobacteria bacterium]|nr:transposase family protein [Deltaproteobacteria bacterium]
MKPVWTLFALQRVCCQVCALVRQVKAGFADPRRSYIKAFERYALELSRHMTIQDAARHPGVSWDVIFRPKLKTLRRHSKE